MHVNEADITLLFSLADMDKLRIMFDNLKNKICNDSSRAVASVTRHHGHPFLQWSPYNQSFFTKIELCRLHRRLGHPHADKQYNVLKRTELRNVAERTRKELQEIKTRCKLCQVNAQAPRRFKITLRDKTELNSSVFWHFLHQCKANFSRGRRDYEVPGCVLAAVSFCWVGLECNEIHLDWCLSGASRCGDSPCRKAVHDWSFPNKRQSDENWNPIHYDWGTQLDVIRGAVSSPAATSF